MRKLLFIFLAASLTFGCGDSKKLTRDRALALIHEVKEFKEPTTILLKSDEHVLVNAKAVDEPEQAAQARAVTEFFRSYPSMAVLRHLGLIDVKVITLQRPQAIKGPQFPIRRPDGTVVTTPPVRLPNELQGWRFKVEPYLTEKGQQAAVGVPSNNGQALPLYRREILEITGLTAAQAGQAQAELTWKTVPTPIGEAFDPASATYQSLPEDLRRALTERQGIFGNTTAVSFGQTRRSTAVFRLYDDGWRLAGIQ